MNTEAACSRRSATAHLREISPSGRRRRWLLLVGATLVASAGFAGPASAVGGSFSGTVTGPGGAPVDATAICVSASNLSSFVAPGGSTRISTDGTYSLGGLNPGDYRVKFDGCDAPASDTYGLQYYRGAKRPGDATSVRVTEGGTQTGVDATLEAGTSISGHVYGGPGTGAPLAGACVSITVRSPNQGGYTFVRRLSTDADGAYTAHGLPADVDYRVQFDRCARDGTPDASYLSEWYDDQESEQTAKPVTPTLADPAVGVDAHLEKLSTISGTVRDADGAPITSEDVCVYPSPGDGGPPVLGVIGATTDAEGRYTLQSLPAGSWVVSFQDCSGSSRNDVPEYWSGARLRTAATPVVLARGQSRTGIDARLEQGVTISGTATSGGDDPGPLGWVCVDAEPASVGGSDFATGTTSSDGTYVLRGLPKDDVGYRVRFRDCSFFPKYVSRFFGGDHRSASAQLVKPAVSAPATGVDARLDLGGTITGTVTDGHGEQLTSGVCVTATSEDDRFSATSSYPDGPGATYRIGALPAGSYSLTASDCEPTFPGQPRPNLVTTTRSTRSTVTTGATTSGVDFVARPASTISGTVFDGAGTSTRLGQICVRATHMAPDGPSVSTTTAADGTYTLRQIDPDERYRVTFTSCGVGKHYRVQYWRDAATPETATPVSSSISTPATGIDAHLSELRAAAVITWGPAAGATTNDPVAVFSFRSDVPGATFECRLDAGAFRPCTSPLRTAALPNGSHDFAVQARTDASADAGPVASRSWTVATGGSSTTSQGDVEAGTPFRSDPSGTAPVATEVTLPTAGTVTVTTEPSTASDGTGYVVFGRQLAIAATRLDGTPATGTAAAPIALVFRVDAAALPAGYDLGTLSVLRDGALAPDCATGDGTAAPDPCVAGRTRDPGTGDVTLTILTTHLSVWNLVRTTPTTTPGPDPGTDTTPGTATDPGSGAGPPPGTGAGAAPGGSAPGASTGGPQGGSVGGQTQSPSARAPTVALSALRVGRLRTVLRSGLRLPLSCSRACDLRVRVTVDGRTARKLRLTRKAVETVVGSASGKGTTGKRTVAVRLSSKARRALAKARSVKLVVVVVARDGSGPTRTVRRTVTVRR